jgi:hypothetical protein
MARTLLCLPLCLLLAPTYPGQDLPEPAPLRIQGRSGADAAGDSLEIAFLEACLKHYAKTVQGYTVTFWKREFIGNTMHPWELIEAHYREQPHSVFFRWHQGHKPLLCNRALYVEGENKDASGKSQVLAYAPVLGIAKENDPEGFFAKQTSRYPMPQFGFRQTMEHVLETWKAAAAEKALHVAYLGLRQVPETGGLTCHTFHRTKYARPEGHDGVTELIMFIDRDTLLQVGSVVYGKDRQLLGEYYFRDLKLNPTMDSSQFQRSAVEK